MLLLGAKLFTDMNHSIYRTTVGKSCISIQTQMI